MCADTETPASAQEHSEAWVKITDQEVIAQHVDAIVSKGLNTYYSAREVHFCVA